MAAIQPNPAPDPNVPPAPPAGTRPSASTASRTATAPKKPELKTDHFRRAMVVGGVFVGMIAFMVLLQGLFRHPHHRQEDQAGKAIVSTPSPGVGLSNYDQSLAAYNLSHHKDGSQGVQADTGNAASPTDEQQPENADDVSFVKQAWRRPMAIKDQPTDYRAGSAGTSSPGQTQYPQAPFQTQALQLPSPPPGFDGPANASSTPDPAQLAARYQAVEARLQRLRLMQEQASEGRLPQQAAGGQP